MTEAQPLTRRELRERERARAAAAAQTAVPAAEPTVPAAPVAEPAAPVAELAAPIAEPQAPAPTPIRIPDAPHTMPVATPERAEATAPVEMIGEPPADDATQDEHDDYFERLATVTADDAPTGMIVMPEILNPDMTGALSRDGDVMLTGSMRVSRELSSLGAYRDGLDQHDDDSDIITDLPRGEYAPVKARDAMAVQQAADVRLAPTPERRLRLWMWVVVAAIGAAVVAGGGLLLIGLTNGWF